SQTLWNNLDFTLHQSSSIGTDQVVNAYKPDLVTKLKARRAALYKTFKLTFNTSIAKTVLVFIYLHNWLQLKPINLFRKQNNTNTPSST
ncbi:10242_t:CDS:1, partial [Ambispora leptoticha]